MLLHFDKGLIYESGQLDAPGKPSVFSTTDAFLRCFGLESLDGLPSLDEKDDEPDNVTIDEAINSVTEEAKV